MPVYTIFSDAGEECLYVAKPLDGDFKKVYPVGLSYHPSAKAARLDDRSIIFQRFSYQGMPVDLTYLPSKVEMGGPKRPLDDLQTSHSIFLVSVKLRAVIEQLEPATHQFSPVEIIWEDGSHADNFFWFYPCVRIDGMDRDATTHEMREKSGLWRDLPGGAYVINLMKVGNHHLWIDSGLALDWVFVSETFRLAAAAAGVVGIKYSAFSAI